MFRRKPAPDLIRGGRRFADKNIRKMRGSLGRLAQTLLARCLEGGGPPCQLVEHLTGSLIEMLEFAQRLALFDHGQVIGKQDVNGVADRRHLQLDGVEPQLLYRASAANAAVADESDRLFAPFSVGVVEGILQ